MSARVKVKAAEYLTAGRLVVTAVDGDVVRAACRGSGAVHRLGHDPGEGWWCSCPARTTCAHLHALQLVTVQRAAGWRGGSRGAA